MDADQLLAERQQKDSFFKTHPQSPLTPEQQALFDGLRYYPPNPDLDLRVTVEPFDADDMIAIHTTTGDVREYGRFGRFTFTVDGQEAQLTIYEADYGFFLPFVDINMGKETYGAGRYLEPEYLGGNDFHVDFNLAYNPFCAYNPNWSCPLTPLENRVKVAIRAGEKIPRGAWVETG